MGPKVDAAIRFLEGGGRRAIISRLETAMPALLGETGTHIVSDADFAALQAKGGGTAGQRLVL
jgi:carbamate kinase